MSITKILADDDLSSAEKLAKVGQIVQCAREGYENTEATISAPDVNTTEGMMCFTHVSDDAKVYMLVKEVQRIRNYAIECSRNTAGTNISKKLEEMIATNRMLCNAAVITDFAYI